MGNIYQFKSSQLNIVMIPIEQGLYRHQTQTGQHKLNVICIVHTSVFIRRFLMKIIFDQNITSPFVVEDVVHVHIHITNCTMTRKLTSCSISMQFYISFQGLFVREIPPHLQCQLERLKRFLGILVTEHTLSPDSSHECIFFNLSIKHNP